MKHTTLRRIALVLCGISLILIAYLHVDNAELEAVSLVMFFCGLACFWLASKPLNPMHIV